jgi:hypothetical protein
MPQEVINGTAILHGIRNDGSDIDIDYLGFIESSKIQHLFDREEIKDEQGFDASIIASNERYECDITLTPKGATRAAVEAATISLEPLDSITFSNFAVDLFNGGWIYIGDQSIELSKGKEGKVTLKFRKYVDETQNTSLNTTVSG